MSAGGAAPACDPADLPGLLALTAAGDGSWHSMHLEPNSQGRVYGGQILAHALLAAGQDVDPARRASALQLMFLRGPDHREPIHYTVTSLQEGRRFSARHVRGRQGAHLVCDAQVSFTAPTPSLAHEADADATAEPESSMPASEIPRAWQDALAAVFNRRITSRPSFEVRLPDPPAGLQLSRHAPRYKLWMRLNRPLPPRPHLQAAALAYLSDHWTTYPAVGAHVRDLAPGERLYQVSLNHALWMHRPVDTDDWLLFDIESPAAGSGTGLVVAQVRDRAGHLVASMTQQCTVGPRAS